MSHLLQDDLQSITKRWEQSIDGSDDSQKAL